MSPCELRRGNSEDESSVVLEKLKSELADEKKVEKENDEEAVVEEDDLKYVQVLKRYFGFSNFRK